MSDRPTPIITITGQATDVTMTYQPANEPRQIGSERRIVRLVALHEKITANHGEQIDFWQAGEFCPQCGKRGRERSGAEFQHMNRCSDCELIWTPKNYYLRIRQPNEKSPNACATAE